MNAPFKPQRHLSVKEEQSRPSASDRSPRQRFKFLKIAPTLLAACRAALGVGLFLLAQPGPTAVAQSPAESEPKAQPSAEAATMEETKTPGATGEAAPSGERMVSGCVPASPVRPATAALEWLVRHQSPEGNWSLQKYTLKCTDKTCTGAAEQESLSAATALGLLPFLGAYVKQTTKDKSVEKFQTAVRGGLDWLLIHQKSDGDLSADAAAKMYSHGLATIALCEDYGMTRDKSVGTAAQQAVKFIEAAQDAKTGGWRGHAGKDCDMSVFAWQMTALKSAELAGLTVKPETLEGAKKWLKSCSMGGADTGKFSSQPGGAPTPAMTAVGVLSNQFLNVAQKDPAIDDGVKYLLANQPDAEKRDPCYWFFGTQVMHNRSEKEWNTWNRKMRNILVGSQVRDGCAFGSWNPEKPASDAWGPLGGRLMQTSLSCLTLEIYYRYLPLFRVDRTEEPASEPATK